jgi:hypothetical protein
MARKAEGTVTKTDGVRKAFAELGNDAPADAVMGFVKQNFGLDLSRSHFFNIKSMLTTKGKKRGRPRKVVAEAGAMSSPAPAPVKVRSAINLDDIQTIKQLADRYGSQSVHSLIELVGK